MRTTSRLAAVGLAITQFRWRVGVAMSTLVLAACGVVLLVASSAHALAANPAVGTVYKVPASIRHDCSKDVTAELNAFLATVPQGTATNPSIVEFKKDKCYRVDGAIGAPQNKDEAGYKRSYLTFEGNGSTVDGSVFADPVKHDGIALTDSDHITISDFTIKGAHPNPCALETPYGPCRGGYVPAYEHQHGIGLFGVDHVAIHNVTIENVYGDGVTVSEGYTPESTNVTIQNSTIDGTGRHGVGITTAEGVVIRNVVFDRISYLVFDLEAEIPTTTVSGITIDNNTIKRHFYGFVSAATGVCVPRRNYVITNNVMQSSGPGWNRPELYFARGEQEAPDCFEEGDGLSIIHNTILFTNGEGEAVWIQRWQKITIDENRIVQTRTDIAPVLFYENISNVSMSRNDWHENPYLYAYGPSFYPQSARNKVVNDDPTLPVQGCGNKTAAGEKPMPCP